MNGIVLISQNYGLIRHSLYSEYMYVYGMLIFNEPTPLCSHWWIGDFIDWEKSAILIAGWNMSSMYDGVKIWLEGRKNL